MSTSTETPSITQTVTTERNHKHPEAKSSTVPRDVSERSSVDIRPKMPPIPTAEEETLPHHAMVKSESFKITRAPLKDADNSEARVKKEKKGKGRREKNGSGSMDGLDSKSKRRQSESSAATSATASDDENDTRSTGRSSVTGPPSHTSRKKSNASAKERDLHPKEYGVSRIMDEEVKKKVVRISADSLESGYTSSICSNESLLYAPPKGILKNPQSTMSSTDSLEGTHGGASGKNKKKGLLGLMNDRRKSHGSTDWRESITFASEDKDEDEEENGKGSKSKPTKSKHNFRHSIAESHEGSRNSLSAPTGHHKSGGASPRSRLASNDSIDWATPRGPGVGGSPNMRKKQLENKNRVFAQDASDTQPKESTSGSQPVVKVVPA
ncbi:hypothetical protein BCR33DRAFT_770112 [Rhizoclosmatium globosum]|uniref:Uncharacterized protein n=1 Tax=Rhizoclosmatium globosum TaxID=329046 RepID=A0A1Y2BQM7_9FUNG|nr:hypothetical protein BCR33DRAFT_770112 [Rhizoclosmatium globosum]|eukprot:ORY36937.1 hypothetical protein BCR33DRAFT_770112 [Rhizoclosmatium globosum]